ncbi:unannotated protein [freshwater metagenome]|uniref:Unannotated protein n=1 Tax=freshwater metagenome TaxID=449393 RepID=A0A6J6GDB3_9ZZZZ
MAPDSGATPITPSIGTAGNETFSFMVTMPSLTLKILVTGDFDL